MTFELETEIINEDKVAEVRAAMASHHLLVAMAETFKVLSDPTRLKIILTLYNRELCVGDVALAAELSQSAVSYHLKTLRQLNLVELRRQGKMAFYSLADAHVSELLAIAKEHAAEIL